MDILQNGELSCGKIHQAVLFKNKQIAVLLQLADDAVGRLGPFIDVLVDVGGKGDFSASDLFFISSS